MKPVTSKDVALAAMGPDRELDDVGAEQSAPVPFDESSVDEKDRNWVSDYGDNVIPKNKGFITDFVYHTRGYMIPTLACLWSALFLLSAAIKREAWLKWRPRALYANLYMIIVGPAGRVKKTTAITSVGLPILRGFRSLLTDKNLYQMKEINVVMDKITPEALVDSMLPDNKEQGNFFFKDAEGKFMSDASGRSIEYKQTSETAIIVSELSTLLSNQQYTSNMASMMLDLYDTDKPFTWRTLHGGLHRLERLCTSFIAGTTIDGLRDSIPKAAKGDGFLSRTTMIFVPSSKRKYPMPIEPFGAPTYADMCQRLAWIAQHALGEFKLSDDAQVEYEKWYEWHYKNMEDNTEIEGAISRRDVILLKVALLIRLSRYEGPEGIIEKTDLMDAIRLIEVTYTNLPFLLGQLSLDDFMANATKIEIKLRNKPEGVSKWDIGRALKIKTDMLHTLLDDFAARHQIVFEYEGKRYNKSVRKYDEKVIWVGEEDAEGENEDDGDRNPFEDRRGSYLNAPEEVRKPTPSRKTRGRKSYSAPQIYGGEQPPDAGDNAGSGGEAATVSNQEEKSTRRTRKMDPGTPGRTVTEESKRNLQSYTPNPKPGKVVPVPPKKKRKKNDGVNSKTTKRRS